MHNNMENSRRLCYLAPMIYDTRKNITFQHMETLYYLIEDQSFSRAARRMSLSQPALTKQIKNLEEVLGRRILHRQGRGISLTEEGHILYAYAKKILQLRQEVRDKVARYGQDAQGQLYIRASTIPATYILPGILRDFRKKHPQITAYIQSGDSDEVIAALMSQEADLGIVGKKPENNKLNVESLWRDRLVIVVPPGHPWQNNNRLNLEDLLKEPFIIRERGSASGELVEQVLRKYGLSSRHHLNISCQMDSSEAVKEAVIAGLGVSVLSWHAVKRELAAGILAQATIDNLQFERFIYLVYRKNLELLGCQRLFIEHLKSCRLPDL